MNSKLFDNVSSSMFTLLQSELCGSVLPQQLMDTITPEQIAEICDLAQKHSLAHWVSNALLNQKLVTAFSPLHTQLFKNVYLTMRRHEQMELTLHQICQTLEAAQIPFIPLKGSVIRKFYPEPWMRNSCDIDILVQEENLDQAISVLESELNYTSKGRDYHDVSLFSPNGVHLELHFTLMEESYFPKANKVIAGVWQDATPVREDSSHLQMSDEMFYFYHILHMAKHFVFGGCGIRPFMDIWVLEHRIQYDPVKRDQLLAKGDLLTFANAVRRLSEVWFSGEPHSTQTHQTEDFILRGGVYGTTENKVAMQQARQGGKHQYLKYRIFPPLSLMKAHYPRLETQGWLLPFYYVVRWFRLLSGGRLRRSVRELQANKNADSETQNLTADFLEQLGL